MILCLNVLVNQYGFPDQVMVAAQAPDGFVPGPDVDDPIEVYTKGYWLASDGIWQQLGAQPSPNYRIDQINKAWVPDYDRVQSQISRQLDQERHRRNQYAIEVNAVMFDGNNTAQTNLKNKLEEVHSRIELGIGMPAELLVWRDSNDQTHTWSDIESYYQFLQTYAIALADRGTRLYLTMWQHKAAIQALVDAGEDVEQIAAYPVDQGWDSPIN